MVLEPGMKEPEEILQGGEACFVRSFSIWRSRMEDKDTVAQEDKQHLGAQKHARSTFMIDHGIINFIPQILCMTPAKVYILICTCYDTLWLVSLRDMLLI